MTHNKKEGKNLYLYVFELLKKGLRPSKINKQGKEEGSIAYYLKTSKQGIQYYLSPMKKAQLIEKKSNGVWIVKKEKLEKEDIELIDKVKKTTQVTRHDTQSFSEKLDPNTKRGHAYRFVLKLPKIADWNNREKILEKNKIEFKKLNNLGGGQKLNFNGKKVHLKSHSIIIYETNSFFSKFAEGIDKTAVYSFFKIVKSLEKHLGADFSKKGEYKFKIVFSEVGLIKNALAQQYNESGKKLSISNIYGEYMIIDNSFFINELEIHQNREGDKKVITRSDKVAEYMNDLDINNYEPKPSVINSRLKEADNNFIKMAEEIKQSSELSLQLSKSQVNTNLVLNQVSSNISTMAKQIEFIVGKLKERD
jgi:hypothetical protein